MTRYEVTTIIGTIANEIAESLGRGTGEYIPWAYYQFPNGSIASVPFLIYYYDDNDDFIADNSNYARIENLVIEFYSDTVDFASEDVIESVLWNSNLVYSKSFSYLESEEMYLLRYESEVLIDKD